MAVGLAQEKSTSGWLTALPVQKHVYTRRLLEMLLLYDMVGHPPTHLLTVHVVQPSLLTMLYRVQTEDFHYFAIMRLGI